MDTTKKNIYLCFTAHDFSDGFDTITAVLSQHKIKASFFLTGDFCRNKANKKIIDRLRTDGHYIGPHSDKHLLYCSWEKRDSLLITKNEFISDLENNYKELAKSGVPERQPGSSYLLMNGITTQLPSGLKKRVLNLWIIHQVPILTRTGHFPKRGNPTFQVIPL